MTPGTETADLAPVREAWSGARVVGLGEATHGTHEFFTFKHRLIAYSITELGVRIVAMETSESAATAVDDYVTHGRGDPARALAGLGFWTWNTREVLALLKWLRAHNAALALEDRVRFAGIDPQLPAAATDEIESFLAHSLPAELPRFTDALTALRHSGISRPALAESKRHQIEDLVEVLEQNTSPGEFPQIRKHTTALVRAARLASAPREVTAGNASVYAERDRIMAEVVTDLASTATTPGPAVAVWAHNAHIQTGLPFEGPATLGMHLRRTFGDRYYALGLVFGSGTFRAKRQRPFRGRTPEPVRHRRGSAPPTTVEGLLARSHPGDHFVDLRDQNPPKVVTDWLATRTFTRQHGAIESPYYRFGFTPTTPGTDYDGLAYLHRTRSSVPCDPPAEPRGTS